MLGYPITRQKLRQYNGMCDIIFNLDCLKLILFTANLLLDHNIVPCLRYFFIKTFILVYVSCVQSENWSEVIKTNLFFQPVMNEGFDIVDRKRRKEIHVILRKKKYSWVYFCQHLHFFNIYVDNFSMLHNTIQN